jgi:hypothetical protein
MDDDLTPPERGHYFFGQALGVDDFQAEQDYGLGKHRRHHRFLHGWGVVCGLGVTGDAGGTVTVQPGLAVDPWGREVVVAAERTLDPRILTDDAGEPSGVEPKEDAVTLCLAYAESATHPTATPEGTIATARITETCHLLVRDGVPARPSRVLTREERDIILSGTAPAAERLALASSEAFSCHAPEADCVVLATVTLRGDGPGVDPWTYRSQLYSVAVLQELVFRLARRVSRLEEPSGAEAAGSAS